jgi:hypothetical protein
MDDQNKLNGFLSFIPNSGYMDILNEYGVGRGTYSGSRTLTNVAQGGTVTDAQIQSSLNQAILNGTLDPPTSQRFYLVYMPPNTAITFANGDFSSLTDFLGYHWGFIDSHGAPVYYGVIAHPTGGTVAVRGLDAFQQQTEVSSHEIAEGVTDPNPGTGWVTPDGQEIGDIVNLQYGNFGGYVVQAEWSNQAGQGVLPQDNTGIGAPQNYVWAPTVGSVHSIVSGYGSVAGLDAHSQVWEYTDGSGWVATGGYGQSITIGQDTQGRNEIWLLAVNHGVWKYDQGQWSFTGGYLNSIVAGYGEAFGLDTNGQVWQFTEGQGWVATRGYVHNLTLGADEQGNDELWAQDNSNQIWHFESGAWTPTGGYLNSIVAGFAGEVFGLDTGSQVWVFTDALGWRATGGYGRSITIGTDGLAHDALWLLAVNNGVWRYDAGQWLFTGGYLNSIVAGYRQAFGFDTTSQVWTLRLGGTWKATGGYGDYIAVGTDASGNNEVWLHATDDSIWRYDDPNSATAGGGGAFSAAMYADGPDMLDPDAVDLALAELATHTRILNHQGTAAR